MKAFKYGVVCKSLAFSPQGCSAGAASAGQVELRAIQTVCCQTFRTLPLQSPLGTLKRRYSTPRPLKAPSARRSAITPQTVQESLEPEVAPPAAR
jgi:hypothetical protein